MSEYMIAFRIIHITSAILWLGAALFYAAFVGPSLSVLGPEAGKFFSHLVRQRKAVIFFLTVSTLTVVAGGFLYWRDSGGLDVDFVDSGFGMTITIGAIAGLISWSIVLSVLAPTSYRLTALAERIAAAGGPPSPDETTAFQALQSRLRIFSWVTIATLGIATLAMASARYVVY